MVTFHSEQPYHKIRRQDTILSSQCLRGVAERCTEVYEEVLKVPYTAELNFSNCRIFEVSYNFKARICKILIEFDPDMYKY